MRLQLLLLVTLISVVPVMAQRKALSIFPLIDNFYIYTTYEDYEGEPYPSNSMYLVTEEGVILFDTPWNDEQFQPLLDSIEKRHHHKVIMCIATHFHDDRTAGFQYFEQKGIKTICSDLTKELCRKNGKIEAAISFAQDTVFSVGEYRFQTFYAGEGHTKDNIVIWFPEQKILYGGCLVKSTETDNIGNLSDANLDAWPNTIKVLIKKFGNAKYIIPGHLSWDSSKSLQHTLDLLRKYKKAKSQ